MNKFSKELRMRREKEGLSLREVEGRAGVSDTLIWRLESGDLNRMRVVQISALAKISDFFGWPLEDMLKKLYKEAYSDAEAKRRA